MNPLELPYQAKSEDEKFFDKVDQAFNAYEDLAILTSEQAAMQACIDEYYRLLVLDKMMKNMSMTEIAYKNAKVILSEEVSVFTIARAVVSAIVGAAKWCLSLLGKTLKFVASFFKREIKDAVVVLDQIAGLIPLCGNEIISIGISKDNVDLLSRIIRAHDDKKDVVPTGTPGMKIDDYKRLYFQKFNAAVPTEAQVTPKGKLKSAPKAIRNARLSALKWTNRDQMNAGANDLITAEECISSILQDLREKSSDMKKIVALCESNGYVKNKFIEEHGPETIDAACICSIVVNDVKLLKNAEDTFTKMVYNLEKASKKYVTAKQ